jgi:hypothetical protein
MSSEQKAGMGGAIAGVVFAAVAAIGLVVYARRRSRRAKQGSLNAGGVAPTPTDANGFDAAAAVGEVGHNGDIGVSAGPPAPGAARSGGGTQSLRMTTGERAAGAPCSPSSEEKQGKGVKAVSVYLSIHLCTGGRVSRA